MTGKALAAAAAAAVALLAAGSAQPRPHAPHKALPLLGIMRIKAPHDSLVRINPQNFRLLPGPRVDVSYASWSWAFSPDRKLLAVGRYDGRQSAYSDAKGFIRLVNPYRPSRVADIPLGPGPLQDGAMAWLAPDRIVAVAWNCCTEDADLVVVDALSRRLVERQPLRAYVIRTVWSGDRLVVLAGKQGGVGAAKLLVIDSNGTVREAVLERIAAGVERIGEEPPDIRVNAVRPGLAVDRAGNRALVFPATGPAAEVDLTSLAVTYHVLARARLSPADRYKNYSEASREAALLPNGVVAVAGGTRQPYVDADGKQQARHDPSGLELVDLSSWTSRMVDPNADSFAVTASGLLATGSRYDSGKESRPSYYGLRVYTFAGERRFTLFKSKYCWVRGTHGNRAAVDVEQETRIIDLVGGRAIGKRNAERMPLLVTEPS